MAMLSQQIDHLRKVLVLVVLELHGIAGAAACSQSSASSELGNAGAPADAAGEAEDSGSGGVGGRLIIPDASADAFDPQAPHELDAASCADRDIVCDDDASPADAAVTLAIVTASCPNQAYCGGTLVHFDGLGCATSFTTTTKAPECIAAALQAVRFACVDAGSSVFKQAIVVCGGP